jgi:hypothetical protein
LEVDLRTQRRRIIDRVYDRPHAWAVCTLRNLVRGTVPGGPGETDEKRQPDGRWSHTAAESPNGV